LKHLPKFIFISSVFPSPTIAIMVGLGNALFPPAPTFTEKDLPSLTGNVIIITGAASGVGYELSKMLYAKGGTVYMAARSEKRCRDAISKIKTEISKSTGTLVSMVIDLADLVTIKPAVDAFLKQENRLDVLIHNAGIMEPPAGSKTKLVSSMGSFLGLSKF
jgi:NAD(P)-dependent dehydrogenase (short-subunit alcohol dehydrogenase family)